MPNRVHPIFRGDYITVTDIPNFGAPGVIAGYNYLPADTRAVSEFQQAGAGLINADRHRAFWQRLGARVGVTGVARCHGCTAYAARTLFQRDFHTAHNVHLWICGRGDHYFLILSNQAGVVAAPTVQVNVNTFDNNDIVVDLWLYNVTRQTTGADNVNDMATTVGNFAFIAGATDLRVFVRYD